MLSIEAIDCAVSPRSLRNLFKRVPKVMKKHLRKFLVSILYTMKKTLDSAQNEHYNEVKNGARIEH